MHPARAMMYGKGSAPSDLTLPRLFKVDISQTTNAVYEVPARLCVHEVKSSSPVNKLQDHMPSVAVIKDIAVIIDVLATLCKCSRCSSAILESVLLYVSDGGTALSFVRTFTGSSIQTTLPIPECEKHNQPLSLDITY